MVKTEGTAKLVEQREEKSIFTITSIVTCITRKRGLSTATVQKYRTYKTYEDCHIYFQQPLMQAAW